MRLPRISLRRLVSRVLACVLAVQGLTLGALFVIDLRRKRLRSPARFPKLRPSTVPIDGGELTVFTYGQDLYDDMLEGIRNARKRIVLVTFIWKGDRTGRAFKKALVEAADRGVEVCLVYDEFANLVVPRPFFSFPSHVNVLRHPLVWGGLGWLNPRNLGRNHNKLMVVDSEVAWVGGYNIGSLYATDWRDTHARVTGPVVADLEDAFVDYWNELPGRHPMLPEVATRSWHSSVRVHRNIPRRAHYPIRGMYLEAIDKATDHIWLTHAYFVPDDDIVRALLAATSRGVDVRLIVPAASNHITADWLSRGYYAQLLAGGVRLFLYQGAMVHAKTATIDGQWSTIGTANLDALSLAGNYEINLELTAAEVAAKLEEVFTIDLSNCTELTLAEWRARPMMVKFSETVLRPYRRFL
ncbi:phosphatidylserine/phosphatidylglycerophosphate/cardiolipin synthase family protein [Desertihabitans brevis]|uniref:Phosphatidylserine/phosphatidylglycerophosphate/ cardiolipin synthase family protein n=1 Tax=Desertihabitans brevis TaxID=2268447 RepID=A0A367YVA1_9ACTN|nr:phosphatidylserine/phosphatidylglycerophosphate/cardiolipin synthase family protein [Desertihabitans brevis]RCK68891.1 phosphatidylserine/phosphatidylglycerophosphate/cardiolipin synthase family protein [Desertihabitans brevis]